ncbi:unnamed protein product [Auanema sp. JU1783]|nr:unnamed protein product [Auanema sp. JU1783]
MGAAEVENLSQQNAELATSKPRERQFQVVPMPGVFTRGRWKCWDYLEPRDEVQVEKKEILEFEKDKGDSTPVTDSNANTVSVTPIEVASDSVTSTCISFDAVTSSDSIPIRESSTIVVTSVGPAPTTNLHGTPQSLNENLTNFVTPVVHTHAETVIGCPVIHTVASSSSSDFGQQHIPVSSSATGIATLPSVQSTPILRPSETPTQLDDDASSGNNGTLQAPNVAAIDNKIEQAMDLVKTHLTFAVREEVEILRQTISDLEMKVAVLESENQLLRQYAPTEIVANLSSLVQKQKEANASLQPIAAIPIIVPPNVSVGFCTSSFARTLNNVRQEMVLATATTKEPGHL